MVLKCSLYYSTAKKKVATISHKAILRQGPNLPKSFVKLASEKHNVLFKGDILDLFYINCDVQCLLDKCEASGELPMFWHPLRFY
jgi:hypothetical protein